MNATINLDIRGEVMHAIAPLIQKISDLEAVIKAKKEDSELLNIKEVKKIVGLKDTSIYVKMKAGEFPKSVKIGGKTLWKRADIQNYIDGLGG